MLSDTQMREMLLHALKPKLYRHELGNHVRRLVAEVLRLQGLTPRCHECGGNTDEIPCPNCGRLTCVACAAEFCCEGTNKVAAGMAR